MTLKTTPSHAQMLAKIETESYAGQAEQKQLTAQIQALQGELATLDARAQARTTQQQIAEETFTECKQAYEADAFLRSIGTLKRTSETEQRYREAEKTYKRQIEQWAKEAEQEEKKRAVLSAELTLKSEKRSTLQDQTQTLERAKEQVLAEQGEAVSQGFQQRLQELVQTRDELQEKTETMLHSLQSELDALVQEAVSALAEWPDLLQQLLSALPCEEDATIRIVQTALQLTTLLLEEGVQIADFSSYEFERAGLGKYFDMEHALSVEASLLTPALRKGSYASLGPLQGKQADLQRFLSYYIERQKGQRG